MRVTPKAKCSLPCDVLASYWAQARSLLGALSHQDETNSTMCKEQGVQVVLEGEGGRNPML